MLRGDYRDEIRGAPPMRPEGSITHFIRDLEGGHGREEAAFVLWGQFFGDLARFALSRLRAMHVDRGVADEEDVAARAFTKVCRGIEAGRLRLASRDDLRRLLLAATAREAIDQMHRGRRDRRECDASSLSRLPGGEEAPELAVLAEEAVRHLLDLLGDDLLRRIARAKLAGYTDEEIMRQLGCSRSTVERKTKLIRKRWAAFAPPDPARPGPRGAATAGGAADVDGTTTILRGLADRG